MTVLRKALQKVGRLVPVGIRKSVKRTGGQAVRAMPTPIRKNLYRALRHDGAPTHASRVRNGAVPMDPLGLTYRAKLRYPSSDAAVAGRLAATVVPDPEMSHKLLRSFIGNEPLRRPTTGGRVVTGILAADLRRALGDAGHTVVPFTAGVAEGLTAQAEVVVIDLAGFTGTWSDALDASGYALFQEILNAISSARQHGASVWLVIRGSGRHSLGGLSLMELETPVAIVPGSTSDEQTHFTEDPGDAPGGVATIIRNLGGFE